MSKVISFSTAHELRKAKNFEESFDRYLEAVNDIMEAPPAMMLEFMLEKVYPNMTMDERSYLYLVFQTVRCIDYEYYFEVASDPRYEVIVDAVLPYLTAKENGEIE